jgi:hypothetical protein
MMASLTGEFPALQAQEPPAPSGTGTERIRRIGSLTG